MTVSPEAVTAAAKAIQTAVNGGTPVVLDLAEDAARRALAAAAPLIAAAERDRIRRLAERHHAQYVRCHEPDCCQPDCRGSFADLLAGDPP